MKATGKKLAGLVAGGALVVSTAPVAQLALADEPGATAEGGGSASLAQAVVHAIANEGANETIEHVQGAFAWNQNVVTDNETLARTLYDGSAYLCGAQGAEATGAERASATSIASIRVTGDVGHAFTASIDEFLQKAPMKKIMGCTCAGNPADGRASANAEVGGFQLAALIDEADPVEGANTITFTSADGYEVALPLRYVTQRYSLIVTTVNGDPADSVIGCSNQLWLGSTAARSFARDVVEIAITEEAEPPTAPGAPASANTPNVGVTKAAS